jgi:hypothetical protein
MGSITCLYNCSFVIKIVIWLRRHSVVIDCFAIE